MPTYSNSVAQSGDSEGTALVVRKIMDGTINTTIISRSFTDKNFQYTGETRDKDGVLFEAMGTDGSCCIIGTVYAEIMKGHNDATTTAKYQQ